MDINSKAKLNNSIEMPFLGLGTYKLTGSKVEQAVLWALEAGYRHIDTASMYGNEKGVGNAIKKTDVPRKELFVTTKIWPDEFDNPLEAFNKSLKRLQLDYVDLYLLHWPREDKKVEAWKALENLYDEGKCRAIGVSNFLERHLNEVLGKTDIVPAVNQVEFHPWLYQKELLEFCNSKNIQMEAYCPLVRAQKLDNDLLLKLASKYSKSPAQILLRWGLQHGLVVIPKSGHRDRIIENSNVFDFELSKEDMESLDALDEGYHLTWNPEEIP